MKATAIKDFKATLSDRGFDCAAGDPVEADARTIEQLEAMGLVATDKNEGAEPRKAESDDKH